MNWLLVIGFLFLTAGLCYGQKGCPEPEDIRPCTCSGSTSLMLTCKNIIESDTLKRVFLNSKRHTFKWVNIQHSIMNYLPHEMFEDVNIQSLHLDNLTLSDMFDKPPKSLKSLKSFKLSKLKVLRGVVWDILDPLVELEELEVFNVSVKVLKNDFSDHASPTIKRIVFHGTETRSIKPGVFQKFVNLERFYMDYGDLTELRRDFFPRPFNSILVIGFNGHPLTSLPDGMFTDMPSLEVVGLMRNKLTVINSEAFGGSASQLTTLSLIGNPIRCDCQLYWLLVNRPFSELKGECATPERLKGKLLDLLTDKDLNCRRSNIGS